MTPKLLERLSNTDTPTICNAIELAQGKRGFNQFTRGNYAVMHNSPQVALGFARTAQIAAENPHNRSEEENKKIRLDYYRYMSEGERPAICVIEDTDPQPVGAFWGEVNTNIHKGFGLSGTLTNGAIRDLGCCPEDYQVIGGSFSVSHRYVHVLNTGQSVTVFGMQVKDGDFVHCDRHGGCIIPADILPEMEHWIDKMFALEKVVIEASKQPNFNFNQFEKAWAELEKKRV
jgi:regulator of RNase E activity RraA